MGPPHPRDGLLPGLLIRRLAPRRLSAPASPIHRCLLVPTPQAGFELLLYFPRGAASSFRAGGLPQGRFLRESEACHS